MNQRKGKVGFIGTRDMGKVPPSSLKRLDELLHTYLVECGYGLSTGAAQGVDRYSAEYALSVGALVDLYLPWSNYEREWVNTVRTNSLVRVEVLDLLHHQEALASVIDYHPNASRLSIPVKRLHARNFLVVRDCIKVVALPLIQGGVPKGGTAQGIRLCEGLGIEVVLIGVA